MAGSMGLESFNPLQYTLLNWLICVPAILITLLRLFVRFRQFHRLYWDDIFAILSLLCLIIMATLNEVESDTLYLIIRMFLELKKSPTTTPRRQTSSLEESANIAKRIGKVNVQQFVFMIFFWTCLWCVKGSLMMFYRRLFVGIHGYMKWWWIVVVFNILAYVVSILTNFLACLPFSSRFSASSLSHCSSAVAVSVLQVATALDIITDLAIMLLPVRLLHGLRISTKQKLGIGSIFCLGTIVMIFAIIRMVSIVPLVRNSNPTATISVALWSIVEAAVAVVIASLPPLKSLITRRGDTGYEGTGTGSKAGMPGSGVGGVGRLGNTSQVGTKGHIRLRDMAASVAGSREQAGYDSEEALYVHKEGTQGIVRTNEVTVTSNPMSKGSEAGIGFVNRN